MNLRTKHQYVGTIPLYHSANIGTVHGELDMYDHTGSTTWLPLVGLQFLAVLEMASNDAFWSAFGTSHISASTSRRCCFVLCSCFFCSPLFQMLRFFLKLHASIVQLPCGLPLYSIAFYHYRERQHIKVCSHGPEEQGASAHLSLRR